MFWIAKTIAGLFGLDISKVQRVVYIVAVLLILLLVLILGLWLRSCLSRPPKLNETQIQKAKVAIQKQDREEMTRILVESDVSEKHIDQTRIDADTQKVNAIEESKNKAAQMSNEEIAAELERRAHP